MKKSAFSVVAATALLALVQGCSQVPQSTAASNIKPGIWAKAQAAGGAVVVDKIAMPTNGWIVIHAVRDGKMDVSGSIGHLYVPAGPSGPHTVPLSEQVAAGGQVVAMLHLDTGNAKVYEFANGSIQPQDLPVIVGEKPVVASIQLN